MARTRVFLSPKHPHAEIHPASNTVGTGVLSGQQRGQGAMLAADLHLSPKLKMCRALHLLPLSAFMSWTGATFLTLHTHTHTHTESCGALRLQYVDLVVRIDAHAHHFQHLL
jgi:hypothetical protein